MFSHPTKFLVILVFAVFSLLCSAEQNNAKPAYPPISSNQGYILINLDVEGVAPSMVLARLSSKNRALATSNVAFESEEKGFRLIAVKPGNYKIAEVITPFFNLPYRLSTEEDERWNFSVEAGKINYIGKLTIARERSEKDVHVSLKNRIATDLHSIKNQYQDLLAQYPLRQAIAYYDDFYADYSSTETGDKHND